MNLKTRQELIDYDYLDKLGEKELEWLNQFTAEYSCADMDREDFSKNVDCIDKKSKQQSDLRNRLRKEDLYTNLKVINMIDNWDDYKSRMTREEELADQLDSLDQFHDSEDEPDESGDGSAD